MKKDLL